MLSQDEQDELLVLAAAYVEALKHDALTPKGKSDHLLREMLGTYGDIETNIAIDQMKQVDALINPTRPALSRWNLDLALKALKHGIQSSSP